MSGVGDVGEGRCGLVANAVAVVTAALCLPSAKSSSEQMAWWAWPLGQTRRLSGREQAPCLCLQPRSLGSERAAPLRKGREVPSRREHSCGWERPPDSLQRPWPAGGPHRHSWCPHSPRGTPTLAPSCAPSVTPHGRAGCGRAGPGPGRGLRKPLGPVSTSQALMSTLGVSGPGLDALHKQR